jgi:riboflavin kinase/FMN adenylyltransferase
MKRLDFMNLVENPTLSSVPMAITIGVFDGIHIGHQEILSVCMGEARKRGLSSMVVTFSKNPKMEAGRLKRTPMLLTDFQKEEIIAKFGFDYYAVIDFSSDFSKLSAVEFLRLLCALCMPKVLVVGEDFRCGNPVSCAGPNELCEYLNGRGQVDVIVPPLKRRADGMVVSSTLVRNCLSEGNLDVVREMLGRPYGLDLTRYSFKFQDGCLEYRTLSMQQMLPETGRYAAELLSEDGEKTNVTVRLTEDTLSILLDGWKGNTVRVRRLDFLMRSDI